MITFSKRPELGDVWHRVDGEWIDDGSETYQGMELIWTTYSVVKVTPRGAWVKCIERSWKKQRFALMPGARWIGATKRDALKGLIARKKRHISILEQQDICAKETLILAKDELEKVEGKQ
jgi:hypothetical protein